MATLHLRDIPDSLRNEYKAVLARQGKNMKQDILEYMQRVIETAPTDTIEKKKGKR